MDIEHIVATANSRNASDLHIEAGRPIAMRVDGQLEFSRLTLQPENLTKLCKELIGLSHWPEFQKRGSWDFSHMVDNTRCRINMFKTARGLAMAIRLLNRSSEMSLRRLNLHPDLLKFSHFQHGLVLFAGPTGSGKSSTMAALLEEINNRDSRHIITLEHPIEYVLDSKNSLIRQREVGRDTPSFAQGLRDTLREDPDVIVVGEMRDQETMRLTLSAAETGHLVFATVHASTVAEAVTRIIGSFAEKERDVLAMQLAGSLVGAICQRMTRRSDSGVMVPECEILFSNDNTRSLIRAGKSVALSDALLTGAREHMWTFDRYRSWLEAKQDWVIEPRGKASKKPATPITESAANQPITEHAPVVAEEPSLVIDGDDDLDSLLNDLR